MWQDLIAWRRAGGPAYLFLTDDGRIVQIFRTFGSGGASLVVGAY
jgi:hypothetical protein